MADKKQPSLSAGSPGTAFPPGSTQSTMPIPPVQQEPGFEDWLSNLLGMGHYGTPLQLPVAPPRASDISLSPEAITNQAVQTINHPNDAPSGHRDVSLPNESGDYGPNASAADIYGNGLDFVEQSQPHRGTFINGQDEYRLWNTLPGQSGPDPSPGGDSTWGSNGDFLGDTTISSLSPNGGGNFLSGLDTQDWLGIAGLGLGATGMFMNARTQKDQFNQQMDLQRQQMAQQNAQFGQSLGQRQAEDGLSATQLDPYKQQNSLASSALRRALLVDGPAQAGVGSATPIDPGKANRASIANQFLNDDALGNAAGNFEAARLHADPGATPLNLSATGLGQAGANAQPAAVPQGAMPGADPALMNALMHDPHMQHAPEKKGGGFWKTLGKIAAIAAPIVAAPFTGGTSLALIGAGAGAASSALNGAGLKGTLLGAGLGAIPMGGSGMVKNGMGGFVRPALSQGLKQAGRQAIRNPRTALAVANALHG